MRKDNFSITVPHIFSPISAFLAESNFLYHHIAHFTVFETIQINLSKVSISNNTLIQSLIKSVIMFIPVPACQKTWIEMNVFFKKESLQYWHTLSDQGTQSKGS